jgi:hypothetical protein
MKRKRYFAARRIIIGIWLIPCVVVLIDNIGNYHWFWKYDGAALGLTMLIGWFLLAYVAPPINQIAAYRRKRDYETRKAMEAYLNDERRS